MTTTPSFRRGSDASKEASKGGNWARTEFFKLEDGKSTIIRFLTDEPDWITVDQHQMVPTKPAPAGHDGNWPEKMGAVCRNDVAFRGMFEDCFICDHIVDGKKLKKPSGRTWALACEREEVFGDGSEELGGPAMKGKVIGIRDKTREVVRKGKDGAADETVIEKAIVVVNQGFKNFFSALQGFAGHYHTILDRDYYIKRSGGGTDTDYQIIPLDPIDIDGERFDLREPKFMERYKTDLDLGEVVLERAADEFYARFFDRRYEVDKDGKVVPTGEAAAPEAPASNDVAPERLTALADRVKGYGPSASPEGSEAPAAEAAESKAPASAGGMKDFG